MKRGEVVAFDYPFSDGTGSKVRPALVVCADGLKRPDTMLVMISGTPSDTCVRIDPSSEPNSGIKKPCHVRCDKLFSVDKRTVQGSVGRISQKTMKQVEECLRRVLGL